MSVISKVANSQKMWVVSEGLATPEKLIEFAEALPTLSTGPAPANIVVTLSGSPESHQLQGPPQEVRAALEEISVKEFVSGNVKATFPGPNNPNFTCSINLGVMQLSLTFQHGPEELVQSIFDFARDFFPRSTGPSETELDSKLSRINTLTKEAENLLSQSKTINSLSTQAGSTIDQITTISQTSQNLLTQIQEFQKTSQTSSIETDTKKNEATQHLAELNNIMAQATANHKSIQESQSNTAAIESKIKQFHEEISENQKKLLEIQTETKATVEDFTSKTNSIVSNNETLQEQIREQLLKATGGRLFGAFNERKEQVNKSKWIWAKASFISIIIQSAAVVWLALEAKGINGQSPFYAQPMFILKATITIPIVALIVFCIRQYANEREVEEVYAFKSALSYSLAPYLELVEEMNQQEGKQEHTQFTVKTIGQIFENPLDHKQNEEKSSKKEGLLTKEILSKVTELIDKIKI